MEEILKGRKVNEITKDLISENKIVKKTAKKPTAKKPTAKSLKEQLADLQIKNNLQKTVNNRIWKKEVLATFKTEKSGRNSLRSNQMSFSNQIIKFDAIKDKESLKKVCLDFEKFYKLTLVDRKNFTNKSKENGKEIANILKAENILQKVLKS